VLGMGLSKPVKNSYMAHLKKLNKFIESGKIKPADSQVNAFITKVQIDMEQGNIELANGAKLVDLATKLLILLD